MAAEAQHETPDNTQGPAWGEPAPRQFRWPASLAIIAAIALYVWLPVRLTVQLQPALLAPGVLLIVVLALTIVAPYHTHNEPRWQRVISFAIIAVLSAANLVTLAKLADALVHGGAAFKALHIDPPTLLLAAVAIWLTNVLVFASWYWELDRGGPGARCNPRHREPDFFFTQMSAPEAARGRWTPGFMDYLFLAYTNATAFSPTDTLPLTYWVKGLMLVQSLASLLTVALVAARAVNILQ